MAAPQSMRGGLRAVWVQPGRRWGLRGIVHSVQGTSAWPHHSAPGRDHRPAEGAQAGGHSRLLHNAVGPGQASHGQV
ncbi:hypothetical protein HaLaN_20906 [Haematococcus lacustris]|uniref:Uncharacterized protein n=1 Tax=Haematococcus lacustris TaxID=44745 RepID=A0A699ZQ68_HAELA|nr:hypothetical protein HaLaN_20906 [Haematococcus lacustris]